ncbi:hypothetical protein LTR53_010223 [Teratosphaeriaceae sp. CCFEE 6253]|nr:hypothetical protein LTR53_010223 [Teratosphaeriaceae sp. CCFEE 6253]
MSTYQSVKTQYASSSNGDFAYRRFSAADGTPLLFLMHFRGTMDKWDPLLINSIAQARPVILVDYRGIGQSSGRVAPSFRESAADLAEFLSLIGVKKIDILGFSIGAFVAQLLALNHRDVLEIQHVVICGSSSSVGPDMPETANDYVTDATVPDLKVEHFKSLFFPRTPAGEKAAEEWWARTAERNERTSGETPMDWASQGLKDDGKAMMAQGQAYGAFQKAESSRGEDGSYDRLGELDVPVLVAQGSDDYMFPTVNSFHLSQKLPDAQLVIYANSGHGFLYQYAELFAKHVVAFLES